jgi:hypothetical protein
MGGCSSLFGRPQLPPGSHGSTTLGWGRSSPLPSARAHKGRSLGSSSRQAGRLSSAISRRWNAARVEVQQDAQHEESTHEAIAASCLDAQISTVVASGVLSNRRDSAAYHHHGQRRRAPSHRGPST